MDKKAAVILINYKDYAKKYLGDFIASLRQQEYQPGFKIFLVDNETSQETAVFLAARAPEAELILNKTNDGFAKGNNDAIRSALREGFEYIFLVNLDTILDRNCLREMVKALEADNSVGAVQARLMLWPDKDKINSLGNVTHFLGFGYSTGYRDFWQATRPSGYPPIGYPSGAAMLCRAAVLREVGLFDEEFWMYNEDQDLGWRIWLAGYKCVLAPAAVVYHKYAFARSIRKYYWMDRNRLIALLKNYRWPTLLFILPAMLSMEAGLAIFSLKSGWFTEKLKVWAYFLNIRQWSYLWAARRQSQRLRKVSDREIIRLITGRIWYQEIDDWKLRAINPVFNLYWKIVRAVIFW